MESSITNIASSILSLDKSISTLLDGKFLSECAVQELCNAAKSILLQESNVHLVRTPVTVVGDIHGQFYDLKELFNIAGCE